MGVVGVLLLSLLEMRKSCFPLTVGEIYHKLWELYCINERRYSHIDSVGGGDVRHDEDFAAREKLMRFLSPEIDRRRFKDDTIGIQGERIQRW